VPQVRSLPHFDQVRSLPHFDLPLDSSSDDGNDDDEYHDNDTNTHALH
jgi:hypothetical protein